MPHEHPSRCLAEFAAHLQWADLPAAVQRRCEDLLLDWLGSALAGKEARPVEAIARHYQAMGPVQGPCEILIHRRSSSPMVAAAINAASSHVVEQDDVHNGSVFHPAAVVFPAALAVAQAQGSSGAEFLQACVAGYEVGIRVGEFLGRAHYKIFHTTGTVGTVAAAVAAGRLLKLNTDQMLHAMGSAGTQAAGLWEFLRDAADSKPLHTAHAASTGLNSAYLALEGLTGAQHILEGPQGMAAGMSSHADTAKLIDKLGQRWALAETSFKFHAACRHTHPAADALLSLLREQALRPQDIEHLSARVHQGALDVLGPVQDPQTVHQAKFSMGTVLALAAWHGFAGLTEFDQHWRDPEVLALRERVTMVLDAEVDAAYPAQWIGKISLLTRDGREFSAKVLEPKGDPGNTLSRAELADKALRLALYRNGANAEEMRVLTAQVWALAAAPRVGFWLV